MKRNQSENSTHSMIPLIEHSGKSKTIKTKDRSMVARGLGREEEGGISEVWEIF